MHNNTDGTGWKAWTGIDEIQRRKWENDDRIKVKYKDEERYKRR